MKQKQKIIRRIKMNNIMKTNNDEVVRISSREVAEMMEYSRHGDLLEKIEKINEVFENGKIRSQDYWVESFYKVEGNNKSYKEYLVTKKGCEFIANKSTGEKGIIFTHKYMERFEQMEKELYGELVPINNLQNIITSTVSKEINRLRKEHSEYIKPLSADKYKITKYIKDRLEITRANEEFKLVKERVLMMLGADKWEDVPVETLLNSMKLIDESISIIKAERPHRQMNWF
jgi:phage regulator Rha-like protein